MNEGLPRNIRIPLYGAIGATTLYILASYIFLGFSLLSGPHDSLGNLSSVWGIAFAALTAIEIFFGTFFILFITLGIARFISNRISGNNTQPSLLPLLTKYYGGLIGAGVGILSGIIYYNYSDLYFLHNPIIDLFMFLFLIPQLLIIPLFGDVDPSKRSLLFVILDILASGGVFFAVFGYGFHVLLNLGGKKKQ